MTEELVKLSDTDLRALLGGLRSGRIAAPYSGFQLSRVLNATTANAVSNALAHLTERGMAAEQISVALELLLADRDRSRAHRETVDLVTSGPEAPGINNRDTSVVVRELFTHAQTSVMVVGYAVYQGDQVFESLAKRMEDRPDLKVQFFLNVARTDGDTTKSEILVARFKQRFQSTQWPAGCRLPEVFYDPRSVADDVPVRSSLHAKCVVIDEERVFVSSANFTDAGQNRNIEVGLNIRSRWLAKRLARHFAMLREAGLMQRAM
ncbi:DISARM system phospholipase D-like protein DrmC [Roseiconus lacunae]|uniref:DISARM system phospholipase D-like protein DrmC n=1 Tax=Roseiconus lacunae TaxID=2605694 RepID=UPI001E304613|nr:DISARM system phospholipase D-like protein DrmC [Roseiconus lacunae]MCD0458652.1 DISARM system phospholipase D-like protein DrmC [Roseiconus lacunae]